MPQSCSSLLAGLANRGVTAQHRGGPRARLDDAGRAACPMVIHGVAGFAKSLARAGSRNACFECAQFRGRKANRQTTAIGKRRAAAGSDGAMNGLGVIYDHGEGVPQDYQKAREWYEKAAGGNTNAQQRLKTLPDN